MPLGSLCRVYFRRARLEVLAPGLVRDEKAGAGGRSGVIGMRAGDGCVRAMARF